VNVLRRLGRGVLTLYFWAFILFLFAPLAALVVFAFNVSATPTLPIVSFSTKWFHAAFADTQLTGALIRSAEIGAAAGLMATALGVTASLGLSARRLRLRGLVVAVLLLPLVVPYISLAVGLLILLDQLGLKISLWAVFFGHVVIALPFAILVVFPRLRSLDPAMIEAARDLGQVFQSHIKRQHRVRTLFGHRRGLVQSRPYRLGAAFELVPCAGVNHQYAPH